MTASQQQACTCVHLSVHPPETGAHEVHGCTPDNVSAGQDRYSRCTGRCTGARNHGGGARPPYYVGGVPPGVHPTTTLQQWLNDLRQRHCTITIDHNVIHIRGHAAHDHDRTHVDRHRHALHLATTGTWTPWWNYVSGRTNQPPAPHEIPTADDGYACTCCGQPAPHLDHHLLPWCDNHWNSDPAPSTP